MATRHTIILADQLAAVGAPHTVPTLQTDVGTARVVRLEDLANEDEEIEHSSLSQGPANCRAALTFAELARLNVRMDDVGIGRCRVGVQGDHLITSPFSSRGGRVS